MLSSFDNFGSDGGNGDEAKKISMESTHPFDDDGYLGYDSRLPTQRFDAFSSVATPTDGDEEEVEDAIAADDPPTSGVGHDNIPVRHVSGDGSFPASQEAFGYRPTDLLGDFASPEVPSRFSVPESNGMGFYEVDHEVGRAEGGFLVSEGPILPSPVEIESEEGFIMQEWSRQNAILLEEKESKEKELRNQIIAEAEEYKKAFHEKRKVNSETNKTHNREREKLFLANQENVSVNVDKQYWKAVSDLIPHEVPNIEKKRGKQDQEKKTSIVVIQGPKPGKPTDLSRLRQILLKLKHNLPPHLKPPSPPASAKDGAAAVAASLAKQPVSSKEPTADGASSNNEKALAAPTEIQTGS